jgi:hypothetical protein
MTPTKEEGEALTSLLKDKEEMMGPEAI